MKTEYQIEQQNKTIKTVIHAYKFYINEPEQKAAYDNLCADLTAKGLDCFESHGGGSHYLPDLDGREIGLELAHLFDNQWNTAPIDGISEKGYRVFDWAQDYQPFGNLKQGHWIEQTKEMDEVRRNRHACGYCGAQEPAQKGYTFCPYCIDSEYLKQEDLFLTRMAPVAGKNKDKRKPLTKAELDHLLPQFLEAQIHGTTKRGKERIAKQRADIEARYQKVTNNARFERDGMIWLMDHGVSLDNVIYYNHTEKFSFGWRRPVSEELKNRLLEIISEFPFAYEIKCSDGKTLEGY